MIKIFYKITDFKITVNLRCFELNEFLSFLFIYPAMIKTDYEGTHVQQIEQKLLTKLKIFLFQFLNNY